MASLPQTMKTTNLFITAFLILSFSIATGQKGKHGSYTQTGTTIVNEFTTLTVDASIGNTSISVAGSTMNGNSYSWFGGDLEPGDLILIIQIQGAIINGSPEPWSGTGWYGLPLDPSWGQIANYNNCGLYEYAEVKSVPSSTSLELRCGLSNDYTVSGNVQVIRIPRFENLTISGTMTTQAWNGSIGGVLAVEVNNDLIINGTMEASELGFRGATSSTTASALGIAQYAIMNSDAGGLKGEGIRGFDADYDLNGGRYGRGAPANGGGGGNAHNAGGGGGGNAGDFLNWNEGVGVPNPAYNNAWDEEAINISNLNSSGGGRGGYTFSGANQNANNSGPGNTVWDGDDRRNHGGLGGRPLDYSSGKIYLGGGGGAGDLNEASSTGGGGGSGGGIIYVLNYGNVSGTGNITSNGENGEITTGTNPGIFNISGNDGAGGAGAGGTVIIKSNGTVSGISISTDGGNGGDQTLVDGGLGDMNEAEGPGGGGGGGYIAISNGAIIRTSNGGMNGVTNSDGLTEFPPNGATSGGIGLPNETISNFFLTTTNDTICSGNTSTLTASVTGTLVGTITWYDAEVGGNIIGTNALTTGVLTANTTYWVGTCPGNYLIPVSVIMSPPVAFNDASVVIGLSSASAGIYTLEVIDAKGCITTVGTYVVGSATSIAVDLTNIVISNENCGNMNGGITGITTTGGFGTITYSWNGSASTDEDLANIAAGSYTLVATDALGCSTSTGPHVISNVSGPSIDISGLSITDESCTLSNGDISGITASGGTAPLTYSWNGNTTLSADTADLAAGSYTLIVSDGGGCTNQTGPHAVIDNTAPLLDTSSLVVTNETCGSTNGVITGIEAIGGNAPLSYSWNGNSTLTSDTSLLGSGSYTLTVTDAFGCVVNSNSITIQNLGLNVETTTLTIVNDACTQGSGSLTGITVSGGTPDYTFEWNGTISLTADTVGLLAGVYTLTITDNVGCIFTTNPYTIIDNSGPTIDSSAIDIIDETCSSVNGSIIGITSSGGLPPYSYTWNGNNSITEDLTGLSGGNYTLIVTDGNGCSSNMGPIIVGFIDGPSIDPTPINITDEVCYSGNGSITGISVTGGTTPYSYTWNGIAGNLDATDLTNSEYTLIVTDDNGCMDSFGPISISNSGAPIAGFDLSGNPLSLGETLVLTNNSSNDAVTYLWDLGDGTTSTDFEPSVTYTSEGSYAICLIAYTAASCADTTCQMVEVFEELESVIGIPTAFSPNNDMHNDILFVRGSGIASFTLMIYNRYGEKVFESNDLSTGWNGTYKGKPENTGVFAYYLEYKYSNGEKGSLKGNITLVK